MQAFECALSEIRPSVLKSSDGNWSQEANDELRKFVRSPGNFRIHGKVGEKNLGKRLSDLKLARIIRLSCFFAALLCSAWLGPHGIVQIGFSWTNLFE